MPQANGAAIKGIIETSFVDWDGNIVCTLFLPGCNFRCGFCFNHELVLEPEKLEDVPRSYVRSYLRSNSDFLDGVCITGGEPTLHRVEELCRMVRELGLRVKLDTNGSNPEKLRSLIDAGLVDFIAMDVKAPLSAESYSAVAGVSVDVSRVRESISLIASEVEHEFRTTVVPGVHGEAEIEAIARSLAELGAERYVLQKFIPELAMDASLRHLKPMSDEQMNALVEVAGRHIEKVRWRGR